MVCCAVAVIALAVTGGGGVLRTGVSPSVLASLCRGAGCRHFDISGSPGDTLGDGLQKGVAGKQLSVVQLLAGEAVEPLHGQHPQTTTARKQGAVQKLGLASGGHLSLSQPHCY